MAVFKRVLCKQRLRQVPPQFSWIDHRLVRDRHISRCSADALALYLFLVTVADGQGLSYYADATICRLLPLRRTPDEPALDEQTLARARRELIDNRLIAWQRPLYQVLALGPPPPSPQARSSQQIQSSPRRPAPPRPQPGRPVDLQSAGAAPRQAQEPHPLAQIFRSMALDSAPLDSAPLDTARGRRDKPFDGAQDRPPIPPHRGKRHDRL
jgi:hypothetical protein